MKAINIQTTRCPLSVLVLVGFVLWACTGEVVGELVGHWSFDEASGTDVYDSSTYGNDGTLGGAPSRVPGVFGGGVSFNGSNQYCQIPDSPSLSVTGPLTISAWVYTDVTFTSDAIISKHYNAEFDLTLRSSGLAYYNGPTWGPNNALLPGVIGTGAWHHITLTRDSTKAVRYYVDGVQTGGPYTPQDVPPDSNYDLFIGCRPDISNDYSGLVDEVWMFNSVLPDYQIVGLKDFNYVILEPASLALLGIGMVGLLFCRRASRRR